MASTWVDSDSKTIVAVLFHVERMASILIIERSHGSELFHSTTTTRQSDAPNHQNSMREQNDFELPKRLPWLDPPPHQNPFHCNYFYYDVVVSAVVMVMSVPLLNSIQHDRQQQRHRAVLLLKLHSFLYSMRLELLFSQQPPEESGRHLEVQCSMSTWSRRVILMGWGGMKTQQQQQLSMIHSTIALVPGSVLVLVHQLAMKYSTSTEHLMLDGETW